MLTLILAVLSQPINLSIFIEKEESASATHTYRLAVDDLLERYNRILIAHGTSVRVQRLLSFAQYTNIKMFSTLELLAGSDKIDERKEEIRKALPGENVIILVSTRLDGDLDKHSVYGICGSIVFVNMGTVSNDVLYGVFLGVVRLLGAVLNAPNMVMNEEQYGDSFVNLSSLDDDKAYDGSLYTKSSIRNDLDHVFARNLKSRDLLKELKECECKYKECKEWSVSAQMNEIESADELVKKFKEFVGQGVAENGGEMVEGLFKYLEKSRARKEKKKDKQNEDIQRNTPVKKKDISNNLLNDNADTNLDDTRKNEKDVTPPNNYVDKGNDVRTNVVNDNTPTITVPNAYVQHQGSANTITTNNNVQRAAPANTITMNNNAQHPFNNPQSVFNNNFPNALLTNIYTQLQRLTESISQSHVPSRISSFNTPVLKRKKLSAFTEPYRMNDYEAMVEEKRKKMAAV